MPEPYAWKLARTVPRGVTLSNESRLLYNQDIFKTLEEVQDKSTKWLWHYNNERPNMALSGITPYQKKMRLIPVENSTSIYS